MSDWNILVGNITKYRKLKSDVVERYLKEHGWVLMEDMKPWDVFDRLEGRKKYRKVRGRLERRIWVPTDVNSETYGVDMSYAVRNIADWDNMCIDDVYNELIGGENG